MSQNVKTKVYKNAISPTILYWSKTWSGQLTEEHRLRECNERVTSKMFEPQKREHTEALKFHIEQLHEIYSSSCILYIFRVM